MSEKRGFDDSIRKKKKKKLIAIKRTKTWSIFPQSFSVVIIGLVKPQQMCFNRGFEAVNDGSSITQQ